MLLAGGCGGGAIGGFTGTFAEMVVTATGRLLPPGSYWTPAKTNMETGKSPL